MSDIDDLNKALSVDLSGAPLKVESLESVLYNVTFNMSDLTPWGVIPMPKEKPNIVQYDFLLTLAKLLDEKSITTHEGNMYLATHSIFGRLYKL